jgi:hypothetical protein
MTRRKERKMARINLQTKTGSVLMGAIVASALVFASPLSAAGTAQASKTRHAVHSVEQRPDNVSDSATASQAPAPDPLVGRTKFDWQDKQPMTTHVGDAQPIAFQDFYPFPEPAPSAEISEGKSNKSLYWIGATGAALAAGVAAYFIFSGEPEREPTVVSIQ